MNLYPKKIDIVEMGLRDGLQSWPLSAGQGLPITTEEKFEVLELLSEAGLKEIEAVAFVSPKAVPQMADAAELFALLKSKGRVPGVVYSALVPNEQGFKKALDSGVAKVAVFTAASESFNQKNINATIDESFTRFAPVLQLAAQNAVVVRGYVSTAFHCPFEGKVSADKTADVAMRLVDLGITDISLGDTIGKATPVEVDALLELLIVKRGLKPDLFAMHFHDTWGRAIANIMVSLAHFITRFDASVGGIGGCPYAPGATGNVATNDVVSLLHDLGIQTGIDLGKLNQAGYRLEEILGKTLPSHVMAACRK